MNNINRTAAPTYSSAAKAKTPQPAQKKAPAAKPAAKSAAKSAAKPAQPVKKAAQAANAQSKAAAVPETDALFGSISPEKVQEALIWAEIFGEPRCRSRHRRGSRMPR